MFSEHTPAVSRALEGANQWALRSGATIIQPVHLLLGLTDEEEGRAATLLVRAGLDLAAARQTLGAVGGDRPVDRDGQPLPFSARSQAVLDQARGVVGSFAVEGTLTSEQVLLALLQTEVTVREELEALGLTWTRLAPNGQGTSQAEESLPLDEPLSCAGDATQMDVARVLDAGANRAREALRVIEDYCRFVLDDRFLTGELKQLRHDLAETLAEIDPDGSMGLTARETLRDVGTSLTTAREQQRQAPLAVAQANLKRLQEALRSLEEFGKLRGPAPGRAFEKLRYRSYTLERAVVLGTSARQRLAEARLYLLVTGSICAAAIDWTIAEAAAGGVQVVQLREKNLPDRELLARARDVRRWTRQAGVLFIMNDRPDVARLVEADGVHLGQEELPVKEARRIVGPDALVGVSTHDLDQVRQAVRDGAGYLGVGPTFPSGTKDFGSLAGLDFVRRATAETTLPTFVIGGINPDNVGEAIAAGARRVAVCQCVCQAEDPRRVAAVLRGALDPMTHREHREHRE